MTFLNLNYLLKALSPNIVTLRIRASMYGWEEEVRAQCIEILGHVVGQPQLLPSTLRTDWSNFLQIQLQNLLTGV
jgi:hypothetical protein